MKDIVKDEHNGRTDHGIDDAHQYKAEERCVKELFYKIREIHGTILFDDLFSVICLSIIDGTALGFHIHTAQILSNDTQRQ